MDVETTISGIVRRIWHYMLGYFRALRRVSELEERLEKLERALADKDLDWVDMRARCKRLLDRTEKAAQRVSTGSTQDAEPIPQQDSGNGGRVLSPHQMEVQQQILRRRAGVS